MFVLNPWAVINVPCEKGLLSFSLLFLAVFDLLSGTEQLECETLASLPRKKGKKKEQRVEKINIIRFSRGALSRPPKGQFSQCAGQEERGGKVGGGRGACNLKLLKTEQSRDSEQCLFVQCSFLLFSFVVSISNRKLFDWDATRAKNGFPLSIFPSPLGGSSWGGRSA